MKKTFGQRKKVEELKVGGMYYCPLAEKVVMIKHQSIVKNVKCATYYSDALGRYLDFVPEDNQLVDFEFTRL